MTRSLVIAPQWIGDAVMAQPLLAALAARDEVLTVAALPWVAPVLRAMPAVAEVIELPFAHGRLDWAERRRIARTLKGRFERAYVLPNSIKAALIPWLARIPLRIGYQGEGRPILLNKRLPNPGGRPPMVAFYAALAGGERVEGARPELALEPARVEAAAAAAGVARGGYWVFAAGAEYGSAKRWPPGHYAALALALHAAYGLPVLLLGSGKEAGLCEQIAAGAPLACRVLAGRTALADAMALIAGARGMVSNDSGLMHVAAAFGIPQVAAFGSTSPEHTPPLNPRATVIWLKNDPQAASELACIPCFERECRFGHTRCLADIAPTRVFDALQRQLAGVEDRPGRGAGG